MIAPLLLLEIAFPAWRKAVVKPTAFATADAQLLLAFLNLYRVSGEERVPDGGAPLGRQLLRIQYPGL